MLFHKQHVFENKAVVTACGQQVSPSTHFELVAATLESIL